MIAADRCLSAPTVRFGVSGLQSHIPAPAINLSLSPHPNQQSFFLCFPFITTKQPVPQVHEISYLYRVRNYLRAEYLQHPGAAAVSRPRCLDLLKTSSFGLCLRLTNSRYILLYLLIHANRNNFSTSSLPRLGNNSTRSMADGIPNLPPTARRMRQQSSGGGQPQFQVLNPPTNTCTQS